MARPRICWGDDYVDDDVRHFRNAVSLGVKMSEARIFVGWPGGFFITSLDPSFRTAFRDMVADLGPPSVVEFRAADEGWVSSEDDFPEVDDVTEIAE